MYHVSSDPGYSHGDFTTFPGAFHAAQQAVIGHWGNATVWDENGLVIARFYPDNSALPWVAEAYRSQVWDTPDTSSTILANYTAACRQSDSIRDNGGDICQVFPGNNDGYFIEAFGKTYRFASIEDPAIIAKLFVDIVSIGPVVAR